MKVFYDKDADLSIIRGKKVAIIGYGSQGHAHANNLKESGVDVTVGLRPGSASATKAQQAGLNVKSIEEAVQGADVVMILAPDEHQAKLYRDQIAPNIRETRIAAVGGHLHWAGVGLRLEVDRARPLPNEPAHECLFNEPHYDFNWQRTYAYDAPIDALPVVRAGDTLRITCTYDNTTGNPHIAKVMAEARQITPPAIVLGAGSRDEMCQAMIAFVE